VDWAIQDKGLHAAPCLRTGGPAHEDLPVRLQAVGRRRRPCAAARTGSGPPAAGLEIIADESYAAADNDMTAQVNRVRALRPDVIINMSATAPPGALVAKKIVQLGITAPILGGLLSLWGAFIGSGIVVALPAVISWLGGSSATQFIAGLQYLIFGVLLICVVLVQAGGHRLRLSNAIGGWRAPRQTAHESSAP
jgi:hypothetical protein